ncbi:MAG: hypothetical protein KGI97_06670 [Alphaproteobacteria bacterium]|nr:hypothetical protein [Alphaproteobacteria bacterium]
MSVYWLFFVSLTVMGALAYNMGVKFGGNAMSVFAFVLTAACTTCIIQACSLTIAKYGFKYDVGHGVNLHNLRYAVMAGAATALIDIAYFFALRYGTVVASQVFWTVGGTIAVTVAAVLLLHETMTSTKAAGIVLGIISVLLLIKQS